MDDKTKDEDLLEKTSGISNNKTKTTIKVTDSVLPPGAPSIGEEPIDKEPVVLPEEKIEDQGEDDSKDRQDPLTTSDDEDLSSSKEELSTPISESPKPEAEVKPKKSLIIVLIVIVALALIGTAVYMYISKQDSKPANPATNTQTTNKNVPAATPADVSKTEEEVDTAMKQADEASDLNVDLSDTALQL